MESYSLSRKLQPYAMMDINRELFNEGHFTDVTLVSNDMKTFTAHRTILSSVSPVLKELLMLQSNHKNPLIFMKDVSQFDLKCLLEFVYLGETEVSAERIKQFLKLGEDFKIKDLIQPPNSNTEQEKQFTDDTIRNCVQEDKEDATAGTDDSNYENSINFENPTDPKPVKGEKMEAIAEGVQDDNEDTNEEIDNMNDDSIDDESNAQRTHSSIPLENENNIKCDTCDKVYTSRGNMLAHKKSAHAGIRFSCDHCEYKATRKNILKKHMIKKHGL